MIHHISIAAQNPLHKVVEFWLENRLMLEFMPPELETEYLQFVQPDIAQQVFGQPIETALA